MSLPTLDTLERVLYILIRKELDVMHEMQLPTGVPKGHTLCVRYDGEKEALLYQFIPPGTRRGLVRKSHEAESMHLTQRQWYFGWFGDGIGPHLLARRTALDYVHSVAVRTFLKATSFTEGDLPIGYHRLAQTYLFPNHENKAVLELSLSP